MYGVAISMELTQVLSRYWISKSIILYYSKYVEKEIVDLVDTDFQRITAL